MPRATQKKVTDIDWWTWTPTERATLMFVIDRDRILLIRKKRGLGAGKINGPGGRIEPGETPEDCAVRETIEETGITALSPTLRGRARFQFTDGYALTVFCFVSFDHSGQAVETDEALPLWTPIERIPYDEMWADDALWLPRLLRGEVFDGRYIFDGDNMLDAAFREPPVLADIACDRPDIGIRVAGPRPTPDSGR
ncbi:MAG: 8-oxo-dGTP diphosphatase [Pseudomonadota bacterium]